MNRTALIILVAALVGGAYLLFKPHQRMDELKEVSTSSSSGPNWRYFEPTSGKFSVEMPVIPQEAADTLNDGVTRQLKRYEMFVSEGNDGSVYMVNTITYPEQSVITNPDEVFKKFIDDLIASTPRNQLLSSNKIQFQGLPGMDFQIKNNDETMINSKMFIQGNTLFVLSYVTKGEGNTNGDFDKFISSFKLKNQSSPK